MNKVRSQPSSSLFNDTEIDLGRVFATIWRGKWSIFALALPVLFLSVYFAYGLATPQFTTTASVIQETDKEPVVDFSAAISGGGVGAGTDPAAINTEIEVLRSRKLLESLVEKLDLVSDPEFNEALQPPAAFSITQSLNSVLSFVGIDSSAVQELSPQQVQDKVVDELLDHLGIANIRQTYVFNITATSESPTKSANIANSLAELYIQDQRKVKADANSVAMEWLTDRVSDLRLELEQAETAVKDFNAATDLINEETLAALNRQVKELRERLENEIARAAILSAEITLLESATPNLQEMALVAEDAVLNRLLVPLLENPDADRGGFDNRFNEILVRTKVASDRLNAQIEALRASIIRQEAAADQQSDDLLTLQQLEREAAASGLLYEFFLSRLKETSVQSGIQEADSRVLSRAVVPLEPSSPRKGAIIIGSTLLAAIFGMGMVILREFRSSTIRASEELEGLTGMSVLGQIPRIPGGRRAKILQYLADKPTSAAAEAVRNLRTSILLADPKNTPQVIMSTSSIPGEGKTTQSLGLAQNLAGLDKKVLLVEGDIRKLVFAEYFNIKGKQGLISVLTGEVDIQEAAVFEPSLNAHVLIGEKSKVNAADIFSGEEFQEFLEEMRTIYDYIIIDTPPVLAVPDARVIGRFVDSVIYTVKWDSTTQRQVTEGLKSLHSVGVEVSGLVLSQINPKGQKRYGYGDTSGTYGSYHEN